MDVFRLPTDRFYKTMTLAGLGLFIFCCFYSYSWWNSTNEEWFKIEKRKGDLAVDLESWTGLMNAWTTASTERRKIAADIEYKKNFGPTDPLTEEEKKAIRDNINKLKQKEGIIVADAENIILLQDTMRSVFREMPSVEQMEKILATIDKDLEHLQSKGNIPELANTIEKVKKEIALSEAKLNQQRRIMTWVYAASFVGVLFSILLFFGGISWWNISENPQLLTYLKTRIAALRAKESPPEQAPSPPASSPSEPLID